jgi:hypothetical protein
VATWAGLVTFMRREYEVIGDEPDEVTILFRYEPDEDDDEDYRDRRSQMVAVVRESLDSTREDWVQIASPFARVGQVDLRAVLEEVGSTTVVGGVAIIGEFVMLRHSLPLVNLDLNEFIDPLVLVSRAADRLERRFVGRDDL